MPRSPSPGLTPAWSARPSSVMSISRASRVVRTPTRALDALEAQTDRDFQVLVVDQSDGGEPPPPRPGVRVLPDAGRGASRARNIAWRALDAGWIVFMDDDCVPEREWAAELRAVLRRDPPADLVSGSVRPDRFFVSTFSRMFDPRTVGFCGTVIVISMVGFEAPNAAVAIRNMQRK